MMKKSSTKEKKKTIKSIFEFFSRNLPRTRKLHGMTSLLRKNMFFAKARPSHVTLKCHVTVFKEKYKIDVNKFWDHFFGENVIIFPTLFVNFGRIFESSGLGSIGLGGRGPNFNGSYLGHQEELGVKQKTLEYLLCL